MRKRDMRNVAFIQWKICLLLFLAAPVSAQVSYQFDLPGDLAEQTNIASTPLPQFQQSPPFYAIAVSNGLLSVSAPVTGVGPLSFQWLLNGAVIANATNDSFFLTNAQRANLGSYQLVARNSAGAVTSAVIIVSFDTDHSGLPDAWQIRYFGALGVDPYSDPDGGGDTVYQDYLDGTNPTNASSNLPRLYLYSTAGGTVSVSPLKAKYQLNESVQITAAAKPGNSFTGWTGSITNQNATLNVVMDANKSITAGFGLPLAQVLDSPNLVWTTGGDSSWFGETNISYDGVSAAQSGEVLVGQQTWLQTSVASGNAIEVAFRWAVSSEQGTNFLGFNINGAPVSRISGGDGLIIWQSQIFLIPPGNGSTVLSWVYAQNVADDDYGWIDLDTGWLDQVHVTPLLLAPGMTDVIAWGDNPNGEVDVPPGLNGVVSLAAGQYHSLALKSDGTVVGWGYNGDGETNIPPAATDVAAISSGWYHNLALKRDGTVVAWGNNDFGQATVPSGLTNVVAVAGGAEYSLALNRNGTVAAWGLDASGQTDVPAGLSNVVAIAAGSLHSLALTSEGTVIAWGDDSYSQTNVPPGLTNVTAIVAGDYFSLALTSGGVVVGWGYNSDNQLEIPAGLSNVVGIAAGSYYSLALLSDGSLVSWGNGAFGQTNVPAASPQVGGFVAIAGGGYHALALLNDGAPIIASPVLNQSVYSGMTAAFNACAAGAPPLSYQWRFNGVAVAGATNALLSLPNVQTINSGAYSVAVSNSLGSVVSSNATLTVINSAPIITTQPASVTLPAGYSGGFSAVATGSLPLSYQWMFEGTNLSGATSANLPLIEVTPGQAGSYQLVVTNSYGSLTSAVVTLAVNQNASGLVFSTVYSFGAIEDNYGNLLDGSYPYAGLVLGTNGSLYGTTSAGGSNFPGFGTVFRIPADGALTNLYSFGNIEDTNGDALDGATPYAALAQGVNGSLYGTTYAGGSNGLAEGGFGTVFRMTANGTLTSLYSFGTIQDANGDPLDGAAPSAALVPGPNGIMYGTTSAGGSNFGGAGTVFQITADGTLTSLYSFGAIVDTNYDLLDGFAPYGALTLGSDGIMYGTTSGGGSYFGSFGTVFRMTTNGALTSLYSFGAIQDTNGNALDGATPYATMVMGSDGRLYGATFGGGANTNGFGTIFRMTTNGTLTTLHSFGMVVDANGYAVDGANPRGGLVQGSDGMFYGTTYNGGTNNSGTLFQLTPDGAFSTLYQFTGANDGANPSGSLIQGTDGSFYGTTVNGGSNGDGAVFHFSVLETPSPPVFQSIIRSSGTFTFAWSTAAGRTYQIQYTTNLNQTLWSNFGTSIVAGGSTLTASDAITSTQRFYRIVLLP